LTFLLLFSATLLLILALDSSLHLPVPDPEAAQRRFPSISYGRICELASGMIDRVREAIRELRELLQ
jgi:hypothetical protein